MTELSEYEKQRLRNIEYNKSVLLALGIKQTFTAIPRQIKDVSKKPKQGVKRKRNSEKNNNIKINKSKTVFDNLENIASNGRSYLTRATRKKLGLSENSDLENVACDSSDGGDGYETPSKPSVRENVFGSIPGLANRGFEQLGPGLRIRIDSKNNVPVGTVWQFRVDCSRDGIHRPTVAGIHGGEEGCYSLALSGGYEDDLDYGECFTYTGEGGRDLKGTKANPKNLRTAPQSKDQTLTRGNLALSKNVENRNPVRVVRGYKLNSDYAPEEGYRYDGLYTVERFWEAVGLSGYQVYKFALRRCDDQLPPPWTTNSVSQEES